MFKDNDGTSLGDGHNSNNKPFVKYQPDEITKQSIEELKMKIEANKPKILDYNPYNPKCKEAILTPLTIICVFVLIMFCLFGIIIKTTSPKFNGITIKDATGFVTLQDGSSLIQLKDGRVFHCEVKE